MLFGLAHATNIISESVGALPQVLVTAVAGYFFYVTRQVSGLLRYRLKRRFARPPADQLADEALW
jgi:hypothetical protein